VRPWEPDNFDKTMKAMRQAPRTFKKADWLLTHYPYHPLVREAIATFVTLAALTDDRIMTEARGKEFIDEEESVLMISSSSFQTERSDNPKCGTILSESRPSMAREACLDIRGP